MENEMGGSGVARLKCIQSQHYRRPQYSKREERADAQSCSEHVLAERQAIALIVGVSIKIGLKSGIKMVE